MSYYQYFLIVISIFALSEVFFFSLIRPYYLKKLKIEGSEISKLPEMAFELFYLVIVIFSLTVSEYLINQGLNVPAFALMGAIFLCYAVFSRLKGFSFYLASALIFDLHRQKSFKEQMYLQGVIITAILAASGVLFLTISFFL